MLIGGDDLLHGVNENGLWHGGHLQPVSSTLHPTGVFFGAEEHDPPF